MSSWHAHGQLHCCLNSVMCQMNGKNKKTTGHESNATSSGYVSTGVPFTGKTQKAQYWMLWHIYSPKFAEQGFTVPT